MKRLFLAAVVAIATLFAGAASATCTTFPNTLTNGTTADATQVMANLNYLSGCASPINNPSFTGNVGINTSSPTSTLQVHGTMLVDGQVQLTGGGAAGVIVGKQYQAGSVSLARASDGSLQGFFGYAGASESSNFTFDSNGGGGYLTFANGSSTERMRIAVGGNVGIGTTTPAYLLDVAGSIRSTQALLSSSAAPTISSCGTSPPAAASGSNNNSGQFTLGTGSTAACTVTFANAFPTAAFCTLTPASAYTGTYYISAQSASAFTVTLGTGTASVKFNYTCGGN